MLNNWAIWVYFNKAKALLLCRNKTRHLVSTQNYDKTLIKFFNLAKPFLDHATYSYAFNQKLCTKGNRAFVLTGTRCWMDKLLFFFLPRYEINHMTKRKGCKQPTQARNRSYQGNAWFTNNFPKQLLAVNTTKLFYSRCVLTKVFWMKGLVCKLLFLFEKSVTANWASMVDRESKYGKGPKSCFEKFIFLQMVSLQPVYSIKTVRTLYKFTGRDK